MLNRTNSRKSPKNNFSHLHWTSWIIWFECDWANCALEFQPKWRHSSTSCNHFVSVRLLMFQSYCLRRYMDLGFANSITGNRIEDTFVGGLQDEERKWWRRVHFAHSWSRSSILHNEYTLYYYFTWKIKTWMHK